MKQAISACFLGIDSLSFFLFHAFFDTIEKDHQFSFRLSLDQHNILRSFCAMFRVNVVHSVRKFCSFSKVNNGKSVLEFKDIPTAKGLPLLGTTLDIIGAGSAPK